MDVVELADRGIAVRGPARLVAPSEQLRHPGWECTTSRFGGDELTGAPCVVQAPQCHGDGSASRAVGVMSIVGGFGALDRRQHLLPDVLVRHGAVALDGGGISVAGSEQGAVGDDHSDVDTAQVGAVEPAQEQVREQCDHDRLVSTTVPGSTQPLCFQRELLADAGGVDGWQDCVDLRHAVLPATHRHARLLRRPCMTLRLARGVEGVQGALRGSGPLVRPARLEAAEVTGEHGVDLRSDLRRGDRQSARDSMGDLRGDATRGQSAQHPRHGPHQAPAGGERLPGTGHGLLLGQ